MIWRAALLLALSACAPAEDPSDPVQTLDTLRTAEVLADELMERHGPEGLALGWIETVVGHALLKLDERGEDPRWRQHAGDWLLRHADAFQADPPRAFDSSDSMSPASVASLLLAREPHLEGSLHPIIDAANLYLDGANRTAEGAITHWSKPSQLLPPDEIWVDSLFMFGMFWLAEHARTGDRSFIDQLVEQYQLFSALCRDPDSQLYLHAYKDASQENIPADPTFWARGNSWVLVAGVHALAQLDPSDPAYEALAPRVRAHAEAILASQAEDGLWHTVMNQPQGEDPANYTETSASALLAWGLLRGTETVLPAAETIPAVIRTIRGIEERIDEGPEGELVLRGTSYGTNPTDYEGYTAVDIGRNLPLGVGSVILLFAEADGLEDRW